MKSKVYKMINRAKHPKFPGLETVTDIAKEFGLTSYAAYRRVIRKGIKTWSIGNQIVIKSSDISKIK